MGNNWDDDDWGDVLYREDKFAGEDAAPAVSWDAPHLRQVVCQYFGYTLHTGDWDSKPAREHTAKHVFVEDLVRKNACVWPTQARRATDALVPSAGALSPRSSHRTGTWCSNPMVHRRCCSSSVIEPSAGYQPALLMAGGF
jgi:hypothetical protein